MLWNGGRASGLALLQECFIIDVDIILFQPHTLGPTANLQTRHTQFDHSLWHMVCEMQVTQHVSWHCCKGIAIQKQMSSLSSPMRCRLPIYKSTHMSDMLYVKSDAVWNACCAQQVQQACWHHHVQAGCELYVQMPRHHLCCKQVTLHLFLALKANGDALLPIYRHRYT